MIKEVFISGQFAKAIYWQKNYYYSIGIEESEKPRPCHASELSFLLKNDMELLEASNIEFSELRKSLLLEWKKQKALIYCVDLLDDCFKNKTLESIISSLELLFEDEDVFKFVKNRFCSLPCSEEVKVPWEILTSKKNEYKKVFEIYCILQKTEKHLKLFWEIWGAIPNNYFYENISYLKTKKDLIDNGIIFSLIQAMANGNKGEFKHSFSLATKLLKLDSKNRVEGFLNKLERSIQKSVSFIAKEEETATNLFRLLIGQRLKTDKIDYEPPLKSKVVKFIKESDVQVKNVPMNFKNLKDNLKSDYKGKDISISQNPNKFKIHYNKPDQLPSYYVTKLQNPNEFEIHSIKVAIDSNKPDQLTFFCRERNILESPPSILNGIDTSGKILSYQKNTRQLTFI